MEPARKRARTDPTVPNGDPEEVNDFPSKVLRIIFGHMGNLKVVAQVCRQWRDLAFSIMPQRCVLKIHGSNLDATRELAMMLPLSRRVYETVSVQLGEFGPTEVNAVQQSLAHITACLSNLYQKGTVRSLRLTVCPDVDMVRLFYMNHIFFNKLEELTVSVFNRSRRGEPAKLERVFLEIGMPMLKSLKWEEFDDYSQVQFGNALFVFRIPLATKVELKRSEGLFSRTQSLVLIRQADALQHLTIPNMDEYFAKEYFSVNRPNLKHLKLKDALLPVPPEQLQNFARNLPQLESLSFGYVKSSFDQEMFLARQFPNLTSLSLMTQKIMLSKLIEALAPLTTLQKLHVDCEDDCQPGRSGTLTLPNLVDFSIEVHYYSPKGNQIQLFAPKLRKFHIFNACDDRREIRVPSIRIASTDQPHLSDLKFHWCAEYQSLFSQPTFTELRKWSSTIWDPEPELAAQIDARFGNLQHLTLSLYNFRDESMDLMMSNVFQHCRDLRYLELEFFGLSFETLSGITQCENLTELRLKEGKIEGPCNRFLIVKRLQRLKLSYVLMVNDELTRFAVRAKVFMYRYRNSVVGNTLYSTTECAEPRLDAFFGTPVAGIREMCIRHNLERRGKPVPPQYMNIKIKDVNPRFESAFSEEDIKRALGPRYRATAILDPRAHRAAQRANRLDSDSDTDGAYSETDSEEEEAALQEKQELEDLDAELEEQMERFRANAAALRGIPD